VKGEGIQKRRGKKEKMRKRRKKSVLWGRRDHLVVKESVWRLVFPMGEKKGKGRKKGGRKEKEISASQKK